MTLLIQRTTILPLLIGLAVAFFGLLPQLQAVVPPPDGCYPNFTTAEGCDALSLLTTGAGNTGLGWRSLFFNTDGSFNTGVGGGALALNNGDSNTAVGAAALLLNTSGTENTATGTDALVHNDSGSSNTANGVDALFYNTQGTNNTAMGFFALLNNSTGHDNTAVGVNALLSNTGSNNIALGAGAGGNVTTADHVICIGANGQTVNNTCYIGQIFGVTSSGGTAVFINSIGQLGTTTSSRRFKDEIKPMDKASEALFALKPVTFCYKKEIDPAGTSQFGLVAEDVEKVNPDLVVRDEKGKPYSVRYDQVNSMLLNEFLKEHRKNEQQEASITQLTSTVVKQEAIVAQQQKGIEILSAQLKEQAAQIQKVSAQLEVSTPAPRVVNNP